MTTTQKTGHPATTAPRPADEITARLRRATGQLNGILAMHEADRPPVEVLDQLAAVRAAIDAVALLLVEHCADRCARRAATAEHPEQVLADFTATVRRYVRSR
jgi:DNA-binding FrmR family transcriptional regulator